MLKQFFSRARRASGAGSPPPRAVPLGVELLEGRDVPTTVVGLATNNAVAEFDSSNPNVITNEVAITGLQTGGEQVIGITFRPNTDALFASTVPAGSTGNTTLRTYSVNPTTGAANFIGSTTSLASVGDRATGYTFDSSTDTIRLVQSNGVNAQINPLTGALVAGDTSLSFTTPATGPVVSAANEEGGTGSTPTLYGIDEGTSSLDLVGGANGNPSPNGGAVTNVGPLGVTLDANSFAGFDINTADGLALAALTVSDVTALYNVDLGSGGASLIGNVGDGTVQLRGLAIEPPAPASVIVVGSNSGGEVQVLNPQTGAVESTFAPFPGFNGAVKVASGDLNGDGVPDVVVTAVAPQGPIKVFDGSTGAQLESFYAFPNFLGTVNIAVGDVNGDGYADILVAANGVGANGHVEVFSGLNNALLTSFYAYPGFGGDVTISAGDFNAGGKDQIVTVAALSGHVKVFNANGSLYTSPSLPGFNFSFDTFTGFDGDVSVATADVTGDGRADLIIASGAGTRGNIRVFDGTSGATLVNFDAFPPFTTEGANVALADVTGDGSLDLVVTPAGSGVATDVQAYNPYGFSLGITYPAFTNYAGGASIAATNT